MSGLICAPTWRFELADYVAAVAVDPSGDRVAAGSLAGDGVVADAATGEVLFKLADHPMGITTLAWSRSGDHLAAGGQDGMVRIVDRDLREIAAIATGAWVQRVAWSPDGQFLAIASGKHVIVAGTDGTVTHRYAPLASTVTDLAWAPNSGRVGAIAYGGITWFEVSDPGLEPTVMFEWKGSLLGLAVAPNGRWACAGSQDATVHLWKLWSGDELSMSGYAAKIERLVFSPEGQWLAVGCLGGLTMWDFSGKGPSGRAPASGDIHDRHIEAIVWQRDGGRLVTGCAAGRLVLWRRPRKARDQMRPLDIDDAGDDGPAGVAQLAWPRVDALFVARADGTVERRPVSG
jgi:WD40 repeat protein